MVNQNFKVWVFFLGLVLTPFITSASNSLTELNNSESFMFINFLMPIVLLKQHNYYQVQKTNERVILSNRIIVKTGKSISKKQLSNRHKQVIKVVLLFEGFKSDYFLLEIKNMNKLSVVLKDFQNMKDIEWVQPDLLQLDHHSKAKSFLQLKNKPKLTTEQKKLREAKKVERKANREQRRKAHDQLIEKNPSPYVAMLNLEKFWKTTKGKGVKLAIIDDGFNLKHEDLKHLDPIFSYDVDIGELGSKPHHHRDSHGSKVAGIIFAAHNKKGIDGIAPEADIITIRQPNTWTSNTLLSFQLAKSAGADIINCSWHSHWLLQPIQEIVDELALHGREGKGIAVVFAAGNEGEKIVANSIESSIESAIVVGAHNDKYERLKSSNYGDTVDIESYGGRAQTTLASGKYGNFSATSLAASIVSGLSALVLSQKPELTLDELVAKLEKIQTNNQKNH